MPASPLRASYSGQPRNSSASASRSNISSDLIQAPLASRSAQQEKPIPKPNITVTQSSKIARGANKEQSVDEAIASASRASARKRKIDSVPAPNNAPAPSRKQLINEPQELSFPADDVQDDNSTPDIKEKESSEPIPTESHQLNSDEVIFLNVSFYCFFFIYLDFYFYIRSNLSMN